MSVLMSASVPPCFTSDRSASSVSVRIPGWGPWAKGATPLTSFVLGGGASGSGVGGVM